MSGGKIKKGRTEEGQGGRGSRTEGGKEERRKEENKKRKAALCRRSDGRAGSELARTHKKKKNALRQ
jgi:hypothetical protein